MMYTSTKLAQNVKKNAAILLLGAIIWLGLSSLSAQTIVQVNPGDNLQQMINANGNNTTFMLKKGMYYTFSVTPKANNIFLGEDETVLSGARLLNNWQKEGNYWVHFGQDQNAFRHGDCAGGYPRCQYPEDLYIDNNLLRHVGSVGEVASGKFFFDYDNDKVYIAQDPAGKKLEICTETNAFKNNGVSNVTIKNFIVEKYAVAAQFGAIGNQAADPGWVVDGCEIRYNHGVGVRIGEGGTLKNSKVHHNGQMGVGANGANVTIENNEIYNNLTVGYDWGWEGGGTKFAGTTNLVVRGNYAHHNNGPGLWTDIDNRNVLYENNLVEYNQNMGIFHEISFAATIRCNTVRHNAINDHQWLYGSQILISTSQDVKVYDNIVTVNAQGGNGITMLQQNRDGGNNWNCKNNEVYNNHVTYLGSEGLTGAAADFQGANMWDNGKNSFHGNHYHAPTLNSSNWEWRDARRDFNGFKGFGQDADGTLDTDLSYATKTACGGTVPTTSFAIPATIELELGTLSGGAGTATNHTGYSGASFVDGYSKAGAITLLNLTAANAGDYTVSLKYSNGNPSASSLSLYLNNVKVKQIQLPTTGTWDTWTAAVETLTFPKGANTLEYRFEVADGGNVNLDQVVIAKVVKTYPVPATIEAEGAELTNATTATNHTGFSGTGFVDGYEAPGPRTLFRVNATNAGNYNFKLFYANAQANSSLSIYVNGKKLKQTNLPLVSTSWDEWGSISEMIALNAGVNTVEYVYEATDGGHVNLDKIEVTNAVTTGFYTENNVSITTVFPNPFTSVIHISQKQSWKLYSNVGQLIAEGNSDVINAEMLESGLYLLKLADSSVYKLTK